MHRLPIVVAFITCSLLTCACVAKDDVDSLSWRVTARLDHDTKHFTQGLVIHGDTFVESTGLYGQSALMIKSRDTAEVIRNRAMPAHWFAEGATVWGDRIIMLTWREQIAQWFDLDLQPLSRMHFNGEGWGITHDGAHLIMSDGTATLQFRSAVDFVVSHTVEVVDRGIAVSGLNELEYARGHVFANVYQTDRVAVIDPTSGEVRAWLDLQPLRQSFAKPPGWNPREHVLNGIGYDKQRDRFYVTGKCWPIIFELEVDALAAAR